MLSLLGITFVASLSGEVLLKGVIAGGLGLFLSTVGLCPMSSVQRFTFGQMFLWDGIGLVPITIGFFAIPEHHRPGGARHKHRRGQVASWAASWKG